MTFENLSIERDGSRRHPVAGPPREAERAAPRRCGSRFPRPSRTSTPTPGCARSCSRAAAKAFCAGIDLLDHAPALAGGGAISGSGESAVGKRRALYDDVRRYQRTASCFADTNKPVIAAVHGACIGAGMDLITACDIRLASADAKFSVRETKIAMVADVGHAAAPAARDRRRPGARADLHRPRHRRRAGARDRAGERRAARRGFRCTRTRAQLAQEIAANSPLAVQGAKQVLGFAVRREVDAALDYVALWNSAFLHSEDLTEAMTAFMQRRAPEFRGQ